MKRFVLALSLLAVFALPAFAEMKDRGMRGHGEGHGQMMAMGTMDRMGTMMAMCVDHADKLGLSDDQLAKLKPVHRAMQRKQVQFKADRQLAEIDFMEIMEVKDFNLDLATAAVQKIAQIQTAHHLEMLKSMKEVRSLLTDEQFKAMKKMMATMNDEKPRGKMMPKKHKGQTRK